MYHSPFFCYEHVFLVNISKLVGILHEQHTGIVEKQVISGINQC